MTPLITVVGIHSDDWIHPQISDRNGSSRRDRLGVATLWKSSRIANSHHSLLRNGSVYYGAPRAFLCIFTRQHQSGNPRDGNGNWLWGGWRNCAASSHSWKAPSLWINFSRCHLGHRGIRSIGSLRLMANLPSGNWHDPDGVDWGKATRAWLKQQRIKSSKE